MTDRFNEIRRIVADDDINEFGWSWLVIKRCFKERGVSFAEFEVKAGLPTGSVSVCKFRRYPLVERSIAMFLHTDANRIWPERYRR